MNYKIGFIGCGNMGGALCSAAAKAVGGENIYASDFISENAHREWFCGFRCAFFNFSGITRENIS